MGGLLKFNGRNPGDLGQDVRNISLPFGVTRNTSKTNSPNKSEFVNEKITKFFDTSIYYNSQF